MIEEQRSIASAQQKIAQILAQLERETGMLVKSLDVQSIDVRVLSDHGPRSQQSVRIEMYRLPGHGW